MIIEKKTPKHRIIAVSKCDKCGKCCTFDSGYVFEGETEQIAKRLGIKTAELKKDYLRESEKFNTKAFKPKLIKTKVTGEESKHVEKPYGRCVFLDNNECTIHDVKPLHCKIGNPCKEHGEAASIWFTLNYFVNEKDPESIRQWAMYLRTHPTIPGGKLDDLVPNKEILQKILSYEILTPEDLEKYLQGKRKSQ